MVRPRKKPPTRNLNFHIGMLLTFMENECGIGMDAMLASYEQRCKSSKVGKYSEQKKAVRKKKGISHGETTMSRWLEWSRNERQIAKDTYGVIISMAIESIPGTDSENVKNNKLERIKKIVYGTMINDFGVKKELIEAVGLKFALEDVSELDK